MEDSLKTGGKKIAIIGAGATGIMSVGALKEEGLNPVCFEVSDRIGGLWNYREESVVGFGSTMSTTIINHSKEMGALSSFPPKKEYNNYMRHRELFQYFKEYYQHVEGDKYVRFNTEVISVKKAEDYDSTGHLSVTVKDKISGEVTTDIYDGVMVCTGHFNYPKMENFPGQEKFKGSIIHTHGLKRAEKFSGKNVLVVGTGCSGLDAAELISTVAKQVYLSCRSGTFVLNRVGPKGYPIDYVLLRRYLTFLLDNFPTRFVSWYLETFYVDNNFENNLYYMQPKYHVLSKDPVLNETISYKLLSGSVIQKGPVKYFTENGVVFDGEDDETEMDAVIMATGYTFKFPFLEDGLLQVENGRIDLYKCMYPAHLPHSSLVFIGFVNPFGPGTPIAEIQCRWAAHLFAGKCELPSREIMLKDVIRRHEANVQRYIPSEFMSVRVDYVSYIDEIASQFGVKPNVLKYLFTDPALFMRLLFGPSLPYQYRLEGPHRWEGAREAIMTAQERLHWPLTREKGSKRSVSQFIYEYIGNLVPRNILFH